MTRRKLRSSDREPSPSSPIAEGLRGLAVPIDLPQINPENARKHSADNLHAIASSLARFGQRTPIVVNRAGNLVEKGNGTLLAARQLGWMEIAALFVEDEPGAARGYAIADNRAGDLSEWDTAVLVEQIEAMEQDTPDLYLDLLLEDLRDVAPEELGPADPEAAGESQEAGEETAEKPSIPSYTITVYCANPEGQAELLRRLTGEGFCCKARGG